MILVESRFVFSSLMSSKYGQKLESFQKSMRGEIARREPRPITINPAGIYAVLTWKRTIPVILIIEEAKAEEAALQGVNEN